MRLKPINTKASITYTVRKDKARTISLPMSVFVEIDMDKDSIAIRNFWSGAYEKWKAENDDVWIKLNPAQMQRLMDNRNFKLLAKWKSCI